MRGFGRLVLVLGVALAGTACGGDETVLSPDAVEAVEVSAGDHPVADPALPEADAPQTEPTADPGAESASAEPGPDVPAEAGETSRTLAVTDVGVAANPDVGLAVAVSFQTDSPALASVLVETDGEPSRVVTSLETSPGSDHQILVLGLLADRDYRFTAMAAVDDLQAQADAPVTFHTAPLPTPFPKFVVTLTPPYTGPSGYFLFSLSKRPLSDSAVKGSDPSKTVPADDDFPDTAVITDGAGRVVWYKRFPELTARLEGFTMLSNGNLVILGYFGFIEFELGGKVVHHFTSADLGLTDLLHHDALLLPNGNYLSLTRELRTPDWLPQGTGVGVVIEFTPAGQVVHRWPVDDFVPLTPAMTVTVVDGTTAVNGDPYHTNSLSYDAVDDTVTVGLFGIGRIFRFVRGTGNLLWSFGNGGSVKLAGTEPWFRSTHGPDCLPDGSILFYDNGQSNFPSNDAPLPGRALRYAFQQDAGGDLVATKVWEHQYDFLSPYMGNVEALADNLVLVCNGARIKELSPPSLSPTIDLVTGDAASSVVYDLEVQPNGVGTQTPEEQTNPSLLLVYRAHYLDRLAKNQD